jgi:hypothetical protein
MVAIELSFVLSVTVQRSFHHCNVLPSGISRSFYSPSGFAPRFVSAQFSASI